MGQFGHLHWEDDMVHIYTCHLSMLNHPNPPTTTNKKVTPSTHANDMLNVVTSNVINVVFYKST
jgi:hypothetical protein